MHTRNILNSLLIALLLAVLCLSTGPTTPAQAEHSLAAPMPQAGSAMDLINAVNAFRAQQGLEPYGVDSTLMSLAQGHSEYQAQIQQCTHNRADGSGPGDQGISAENIACGPDLSVQGAVYGQWTDSLHMATMLGPSSGLIGAGAASNGSTVYYTLAVKRLAGEFTYNPPTATLDPNGGANAAGQPQAVAYQAQAGEPTSTPNPDGSIAHVIKYGETLVEIADRYGISLADLISMNKLDPKKPVYYEKQVLIIRLAFTETPYMTATYTPRPATRTPMPTRTPRPTKTATEPRTPAPTQTPTAEPMVKVPSMDDLGPARPVMAYAFIGISAVGLLVLLFTAFPMGRKRE